MQVSANQNTCPVLCDGEKTIGGNHREGGVAGEELHSSQSLCFETRICFLSRVVVIAARSSVPQLSDLQKHMMCPQRTLWFPEK